MLYGAKNRHLLLDGARMDYVTFGTGPRNLVMLPGLGDGLHTVKGTARPVAAMYRAYAKSFRVYLFSQPDPIRPDCTSLSMARDLKSAMQMLGIRQACVLGVSQGGTIAQQLAIHYPQTVERLVLVSTFPCPDPQVRSTVAQWTALARAGDTRRLMEERFECFFTERTLKKYRSLYPLLTRLEKVSSYDRFLSLAQACLTHDCSDQLSSITCPTLVLGGDQDKIIQPQSFRDLAAAIPNSQFYLYRGLGHGAIQEAHGLNTRILHFLNR